MRYSIDVGGISDVTRVVAREMDDASAAIVAALAAADVALSAVSSEGGLAGALSAAVDPRRSTGPNAVARAGALTAVAQANALSYVQADEVMAATTEAASGQASAAEQAATARYAGRFGGGIPR